MGCFLMCFGSKQKKNRKNLRRTYSQQNRFRDCSLTPTTTLTLKEQVLCSTENGPPRNLQNRVTTKPRWTQNLSSPLEISELAKRKRHVLSTTTDISTEVSGNANDGTLDEMDALAIELADLSRIIQAETEDFKKISDEVKYLKRRGTSAAASHKQADSVQEERLQSVGSEMKRLVSDKQVDSQTPGKSVLLEKFPTHSEMEAYCQKAKEDALSSSTQQPSYSEKAGYQKAQDDVLASPSMEHLSSTEQNQYSSSTGSTSRSKTFSLESETTSTPYESLSSGTLENKYSSTSPASKSSYTVSQEREGSSQQAFSNTSYSYTDSEITISNPSNGTYTDGSVTATLSSGNGTGCEASSTTSHSSINAKFRYSDYESGEEEYYDSIIESDESCCSDHSMTRSSIESIEDLEVSSEFNKQTPPLAKSNYSPLKPSEAHKQSSVANGNPRIRAQYVDQVLNPVENLSQWRALKDSKVDGYGNFQEFYEVAPSNAPAKTKVSPSKKNIAQVGSACKENSCVAEKKECIEIVSKEPVDNSGPKDDGVYVYASLSHWIKPSSNSAKDESHGCAGQLKRQKENVEDLDNHKNSGSQSIPLTPASNSLMAQDYKHLIGSHSINNDERPILGALSAENIREAMMNEASPRKSPSSKDLDNRPILGDSYSWNDKRISPSKLKVVRRGIAESFSDHTEQNISYPDRKSEEIPSKISSSGCMRI